MGVTFTGPHGHQLHGEVFQEQDSVKRAFRSSKIVWLCQATAALENCTMTATNLSDAGADPRLRGFAGVRHFTQSVSSPSFRAM